MRQSRRDIISWVGRNIIPHEAHLRARLRHMAASEDEIDDIVQEAYLRISKLDTVAHIRNGRAYFFATARSVVLQRIRRKRIVRIDTLADMDSLELEDDVPSPERQASARAELRRVKKLIDDLPERCREIFTLRRIEGVPQREIAARLGVTENVVEGQAARGLKLLLKAIAVDEAGRKQNRHEADRGQRDNVGQY